MYSPGPSQDIPHLDSDSQRKYINIPRWKIYEDPELREFLLQFLCKKERSPYLGGSCIPMVLHKCLVSLEVST